MNMLQNGLWWLSEKQTKHVSSKVLYCRDDNRHSVDAVLGRTKYEIVDENGFKVAGHAIDFLIAAVDLPFVPQVGDQIFRQDQHDYQDSFISCESCQSCPKNKGQSMFEKIKSIFSGIGYAIKYSDVIRNVTTAWAKYPGVEDSSALRLWLRPLLTDAASLALLTKTSIDDLVVQAAVKIVDSNNAWAVVHGMALLIQDGIGEHAVPSRMELPLRCNNPLPLGAGVDERNNVERIIGTEGYCGEAACFPSRSEDVFEMSRRVARETMPECPAAVISAIGVILFLLQSRQRNPSFRALK